MLAKAISLGIHGIEAHIIEVEVDIIKGLPGFVIGGLPDPTIRESRERIRSAIENSHFDFPPQNFVVNLAPAGFKKQGAYLDLPIAISVLSATGQMSVEPHAIPMVGELSLDGRVKPVQGVISMAIALYKKGFRSLIVPYENRHEAAAINEISIFPVKDINAAISVLKGEVAAFSGHPPVQPKHAYAYDFSSVRGQEHAKRALEIAAAGHHNIILYGPPGSGKTLLAKTFPSILPDLSREEAIETTMIHSVGGKLQPDSGLLTRPPFRAPHHSASDAAIIGGGKIPSVGEVSVAHNGILFLDEFVEFKNNVIQALRQPLEDHEIAIARASGSFLFPADFMLVAASNPCQCGFLFDDEVMCTCTPVKVKNYFQKISGPILDRIDLEVFVNRVACNDLLNKQSAEPSAAITKRVLQAREMQKKRFCHKAVRFNSRMNHMETQTFCEISAESRNKLETAIKKMNLSARAFYKILKVSRTIADLDASEQILTRHIMEALTYKNLQKNYNV